jgi:putative ABC transport system permease protein
MWWRKVQGDARQHWLQIGLIALVLSIGTAGVVAALNAQAILKREIASSFASAKSPDVALLYDRVTPELLADADVQPGVGGTDARRMVTTRIEAKDGTWLPMRLTIVRDLSKQQLGVVHLHGSAWPAQDGAIWIEQSGETLLTAGVGGSLKVRTPNGDIANIPVGGFAHDTAVAPSFQDRMIYAYVNERTAAQLGQNPVLDQLLVKMVRRGTFAETLAFGNALNASLQKRGIAAQRVEVLPAIHPHDLLMNAMLRVLGVLSVLALLCSAALAGYMVAAWMRREIRQVGIMKTLGAQSMQIARQSLWLVTPIVLLAAGMGMVLGAALARAMVQQYAVTLNIDVVMAQVPHDLLWEEILLAVGAPLLAMALPIMRAARMTALAAMQEVGITPPPSLGRWASLLLRVPGNVAWTLALRNTWRRPWRLALIVLALTSGGTLLLTTHSNYESLIGMIDISLAQQGHDIEVLMQRSAPAAQLEATARSVPEVEIAEAWHRASVSMVPLQGSAPATEPKRFALTAYPDGSQLFKLPIVSGRASHTGSSDEVLVTRRLQTSYPTLQVGSSAALRFRDREVTVKVVGLVEEIAMPLMYTNAATFEAVTALGESANAVRVKTRNPQIELVANALDQAFLKAHLIPGQVIPRTMVREALDEHVKVVDDVIRMVGLAAALVGAIVLASTTVLNVIERSREVGILRTLGAKPAQIAGMFLAEGGSITLLSAALAVILSLLLTRVLLNAAERSLVNVTVPLQFSWSGFGILASGALVVLLMVALSLVFALRKSVHATLAYE